MKEQIEKSSNWLIEGVSQEELKSEKILAVISAKIQLKRLEMNMDQKQFAKLLGVTQGMVSKWESGSYNFTITTLVNICENLNLEFSPSITSKEKVATEETSLCKILTMKELEQKAFKKWSPSTKNQYEGAVAYGF